MSALSPKYPVVVAGPVGAPALASWVSNRCLHLWSRVFMGCTIDHLSVDHRISVIQEFTDARGAHHGVGERGLIRELGLDGLTCMIMVRWERDGQDETMWFALASTTGPGNGRMREYFALDEYVRPEIEGQRWIPGGGSVPVMPDIPAVRNEVIRTFAHYGDAIERVWALVARQRFDEAEAQVMALLDAEDRHGDLSAHVAATSARTRARMPTTST